MTRTATSRPRAARASPTTRRISLVSMNGGAVTITYDGDGNRVAKTVNGMTTKYLVDDLNPTGYAQVMEELVVRCCHADSTRMACSASARTQSISGTWTPSFYGYDGGGNVRQLTNTAGHHYRHLRLRRLRQSAQLNRAPRPTSTSIAANSGTRT